MTTAQTRDALREALDYLTPHPSTKGPVILDPAKMRAAVSALEAEVEELKAERDEAREVVALCNNSFGSYSYHTSPHPAEQIEKIKEQARSEWRRAEEARALVQRSGEERDRARDLNRDLHRRVQKAESFRARHGNTYGVKARWRDRQRRRKAEAERDEAVKDMEAAEAHAYGLDEKIASLSPHGTCACSYDRPGDVCMHHSPALVAAIAERDRAVADLDAARDALEAIDDLATRWCQGKAYRSSGSEDARDGFKRGALSVAVAVRRLICDRDPQFHDRIAARQRAARSVTEPTEGAMSDNSILDRPLTNAERLMVFVGYHSDKLPKRLQDELLDFAYEWQGEASHGRPVNTVLADKIEAEARYAKDQGFERSTVLLSEDDSAAIVAALRKDVAPGKTSETSHAR